MPLLALRLVAMLLLAAAPAPAQSVIAEHESAVPLGLYGVSAAFLGDMDGDGVSEYAVGATGQLQSVFVHDGAFGSERFVAGPGDNGFGHALAGSDLDGDGLADLLVGWSLAGIISAFSGLDGAPLGQWNGLSRELASVGDLDGDGVFDLVGGNPAELAGSEQVIHGAIAVYSGASGAELRYHVGTPGSQLGDAVAGVGDLDGDGVPEYAGGAPAGQPGFVQVHSGADGSPWWSAQAAGAQSSFGKDITALGDVNLDGTPDLAVGAPGFFPSVVSQVVLLDGSDGAVLSHIDSTGSLGFLGTAVAAAGDVDGNGRPDVLLTRNDTAPPRLECRDAFTHDLLFTFTGDGQGFGTDLDAGPDVDGDGAVDFLVTHESSQASFPSRAWLASTRDLPWEWLGQGLAGADGKPLLRGEGPLTAGSSVTLKASQAPPSSACFLVLGATILGAPYKGGTLVPAPDLIVAFSTDADGRLVLVGTWPAGLPEDFELVFQAWFSDAGGPSGLSASNGLLAVRP